MGNRLDIDENRSLWLDEAGEEQPRTSLSGEVRADVVIIGAGFTGLSTAWHLARRFPARRVIVVEARRVANGASGRNGGQVLNWINGVETTEEVLTRRVHGVTAAGIQWIYDLIRDHSLRVDHSRLGCLEVYTTNAHAEEAHAKVERLKAWGIPVEYLTGRALDERLRLAGAKGAVLDPLAGQVNGVQLARGLAGLCERAGVTIYEDTPVLQVEQGPECRLVCARGAVTAPAVVLATNGYTHRLGFFRSGLFPLHSHVLATAPGALDAAGWGGTSGFADDMDRIAYGARTGSGRVVFGGGSNASYGYQYGNRTSWAGGDAHGQAAVLRRLHEALPGLAQVPVTHRWTGTLAITLDRICAIGLTGNYGNVYYAFGYSGHGVVLAHVAGQVISDIYAGEGERWRDLPFYMRRPGGIPPEPLRWVGYQAYTRLTGRSPRRPA
jgi:gamma-glutamylputrescine oxidase